jgi:hypothetical protein
MQSFGVLKWVVHIVTTGLYRVKRCRDRSLKATAGEGPKEHAAGRTAPDLIWKTTAELEHCKVQKKKQTGNSKNPNKQADKIKIM